MDVRDTVVNPPASNAQNIIINNYDKGTELESKTLPNEGGGLTINVLPSSQPPAQPDQPPAALSPAPQPEITAPKTNSTSKTAPVQASKPPQQTPPPPAVKTSPPATTGQPKPAAAPAYPAAKPAAVYDYWKQAGAFSSQTRAENAKKALREKGILSSTVENVTVNGQDFFRVRIGPYTSRDEAAYWLKLIKVMDSLNESYITQTPRP
jgi:cell division protein FtsN